MQRTTLFCYATLLSLCFWTPKAIAQEETSCINVTRGYVEPELMQYATCVHMEKEYLEAIYNLGIEAEYDAFVIYGEPMDENPQAIFFITPVEYGHAIVVGEFNPTTLEFVTEGMLLAQGDVIIDSNSDQIMLRKYEPELRAALLTQLSGSNSHNRVQTSSRMQRI